MSLTDDTNVNTIDIPLPVDSTADPVTSGQVDVKQAPLNGVAPAVAAPMAVPYGQPYANPYAVHQSFPYYPYYPPAGTANAFQQMHHQMPQMMVNQFGYFVPPMVRPIVPVIPQLQTSFAVPNTAITAMNNAKTKAAEDNEDDDEEDEEDSDSDPTVARRPRKASNILPLRCNETMGLNPLIYQNIQSSPYFKNNLFQLKTYHEVIDEIYYSVKHLEPWEKGSRKVGGQTGMCGSVRGVGAGGIISTPFCILYKLFTLKLTRKQVNGLIRHKDSPYIRALGFMYIRFTQPAQDLYQWFEPFLEDEEEVDPKAGGGQVMTIGQMCRHMLSKLDWFSTLFPRVPVPIQKQIEKQLKQRDAEYEQQMREERGVEEGEVEEEEQQPVEEEPVRRGGGAQRGGRQQRDRSRERDRRRPEKDDRRRSRSRDKDRQSNSRDDHNSRSNDRHRRRSRSPHTSPNQRQSRADHRPDRDRGDRSDGHRHRRH